MTDVVSRARPLLGTLVTLRIAGMGQVCDMATVGSVAEQAFTLVGHIARVMSAHHPDSDLGRMSRAQPNEVLDLDPHTVQVLRATQYWVHRSGGAFNPARAGHALARLGARPGLKAGMGAQPSIADIEMLSERRVKMPASLSLDLGGIAKGYAVDQAAECLMRHGVSAALINAGGDLRVVGSRAWPVEVRHAGVHLRDRVLMANGRMTEGALATSVGASTETDFVRTTARGVRQWRSASVVARDCMTADVLTKWALQSSLLCPSLKSAMREHHARLWRS